MTKPTQKQVMYISMTARNFKNNLEDKYEERNGQKADLRILNLEQFIENKMTLIEASQVIGFFKNNNIRRGLELLKHVGAPIKSIELE